MQRPASSTLYVRFRKRVRLSRPQPIALGTIAQLIADPDVEERVRRLIVAAPSDKDGNLVLIDMMGVVRVVRRAFPSMSIEHFGEPHVLVEIDSQHYRPRVLMIAVVWVLLFLGSGLTIMNFHADVSMQAVHCRIVELLTGKTVERPYLLQIPYSIGIGAGMVLFFNHLFKKKFNEEPTPLEVEMFTYQENVNRYVITEEYGKLHPGGEEPADGDIRR